VTIALQEVGAAATSAGAGMLLVFGLAMMRLFSFVNLLLAF
jgi:hypothetical protein